MPPTPEQTENGYRALWERARVRQDRQSEVARVASKIGGSPHWNIYLRISGATGVPAEMIGPIHNRESSLNFNTHLHNGDPLTARTRHVPANRPAAGNPPFTFDESAIDALMMAPHSLHKVKDWTLERILYETERYNGWGYLGKGNSPYLWAATDQYHGGKYVADGVYDANAWDRQLGCVALLKQMAANNPEIASNLARRQPKMPSDVKASIPSDGKFKEVTKTERRTATGGAAAGASGGAGELSKTTGKEIPVAHPFITYPAIAIGAVLLVVSIILIVRKRNAIVARWGA